MLLLPALAACTRPDAPHVEAPRLREALRLAVSGAAEAEPACDALTRPHDRDFCLLALAEMSPDPARRRAVCTSMAPGPWQDACVLQDAEVSATAGAWGAAMTRCAEAGELATDCARRVALLSYRATGRLDPDAEAALPAAAPTLTPEGSWRVVVRRQVYREQARAEPRADLALCAAAEAPEECEDALRDVFALRWEGAIRRDPDLLVRWCAALAGTGPPLPPAELEERKLAWVPAPTLDEAVSTLARRYCGRPAPP